MICFQLSLCTLWTATWRQGEMTANHIWQTNTRSLSTVIWPNYRVKDWIQSPGEVLTCLTFAQDKMCWCSTDEYINAIHTLEVPSLITLEDSSVSVVFKRISMRNRQQSTKTSRAEDSQYTTQPKANQYDGFQRIHYPRKIYLFTRPVRIRCLDHGTGLLCTSRFPPPSIHTSVNRCQ